MYPGTSIITHAAVSRWNPAVVLKITCCLRLLTLNCFFFCHGACLNMCVLTLVDCIWRKLLHILIIISNTPNKKPFSFFFSPKVRDVRQGLQKAVVAARAQQDRPRLRREEVLLRDLWEEVLHHGPRQEAHGRWVGSVLASPASRFCFPLIVVQDLFWVLFPSSMFFFLVDKHLISQPGLLVSLF